MSPERTPTARLETLLARVGIKQIDLLVIDTEGHDYEILRELDFTRFKPVVLMFEHQHLSDEDKAAAYALLRKQRYEYRETVEGDAIVTPEYVIEKSLNLKIGKKRFLKVTVK